jgi:hypothetical protein
MDFTALLYLDRSSKQSFFFLICGLLLMIPMISSVDLPTFLLLL